MRNHTPRSVGHNLTSSFEGYPVAVAAHFNGPDTYDDLEKTHGCWLRDALLQAQLENYVIDFIEVHETFILIHHRRPHGSFIPQRPALVFQYKYVYRTRNFHQGEQPHPAGERCLAWRDNGKLFLEFDYETIELENHFLRGIEGGLFGDMIEDIRTQCDEEVMADIQRAAGDKDYVTRQEA